MNLAGLNIRDLDYVVAVAEFLHFGKAAQSRNVSQPTLSAQLRKLEETLGVTLFERGARGVLVTAAGAPLVAQARVILAESRRLGELAMAAAEPLTGPFRLGVIATLGPYLLPLLLAPMRARYPKLQLVLTEGMTRPLIHALEAGELDAVIASTPVEDPALTALPLFREALVLAVPRDHPLAAVERVELADLPVEDLILLSEGHCLRDQALACCPQALRNGRGVQGGRQAASLETLRQMIGHGLGCSLLPQLAVQVGSLLDDMVAYRLVHGSSPERQLALIHRPSFGRIRDIRLLRELLLDALASAGTLTVHARPSTQRDALPRG
ncbi:LysR substrate-binding domain-containing protein [Roseomonas sp. 18066]|uniref:LysR substrate-binding domain-containing protein n=1 Tax=Roseomonas sp. 18066 TaxID=2681412 RepID=UPI00135A63C2|nr:LysR substrate-binding domain-containing protein [Roseomonas sp. 18066]